MMFHSPRRLALFGLLTLCLSGLCRGAERPNIVLLLADDLTYQGVHALSNEPVRTPHLDRLAARATAFDRCYNMGSWHGAVCIASRTMLNTGRSLWHAQAVYDASEQERQAGRWWSEYLRKAGYRTYLTGKWHVKASAERAFDVVSHVRPGMPLDTPDAYNRPVEGQPDPWSPSDRSRGGYWEGGRHWSEVVAEDAIEFLQDAGRHPQPYFLYIAFNAPHDPRQSPQEFLDLYPPEEVPVPVNFLPVYPFQEAMGCGPTLRDERLAPFPRTESAVRVHRREYFALISHLDAQIGRILDALAQSPGADNTWIIFTSDHGLSVGQHGLLGKQNQYEPSVRVPFLLAGPGAAPGVRLTTPIYMQDVVPTTLALAGIDRPAHVEFQDLLPILRGERESVYTSIYGAYLQLQRMVSCEGWKLIVYPQASAVRLYHVEEDPHELHDLAADPEQQPRIKRLFAELLRLQEQLDDRLDLREAFPQLL